MGIVSATPGLKRNLALASADNADLVQDPADTRVLAQRRVIAPVTGDARRREWAAEGSGYPCAVGVEAPVKPVTERVGPESGHGEPCHVIVLNDDHNTFEHVARTLARFIPGIDYEKGMALANTIHTAGEARVWSGPQEQAELYWEQLKDAGLTLAPLAC